MRVSSATRATAQPARNASATYSSRSAPGARSSCARRSRLSSVSGIDSCGVSPSRPVSSPRSAFCSDSWNVRPMAMTSPTDFIWVVSRSLAAGNFSNVKRGNFTTT